MDDVRDDPRVAGAPVGEVEAEMEARLLGRGGRRVAHLDRHLAASARRRSWPVEATRGGRGRTQDWRREPSLPQRSLALSVRPPSDVFNYPKEENPRHGPRTSPSPPRSLLWRGARRARMPPARRPQSPGSSTATRSRPRPASASASSRSTPPSWGTSECYGQEASAALRDLLPPGTEHPPRGRPAPRRRRPLRPPPPLRPPRRHERQPRARPQRRRVRLVLRGRPGPLRRRAPRRAARRGPRRRPRPLGRLPRHAELDPERRRRHR